MGIWRTFKNWFTPGETYNVYALGERLIYHYFDGQQMVAADPLVVYKAMMDVGPELAIDIKVSLSPLKEARTANDNLLKNIRKIFNVKPFAEGGLTDVETAGLLDHFLVFCAQLKKNSSPSAISSMPSADSNATSANGPPTLRTSDSGSTASVPSTAAPEPLPSGPASPSVP